MRRVKQTIKKTLSFVLLLVLIPAPALADTSSSTNYRVEQTFFGTGGELDASSTNYRAKQTSGELGVGKTCSAAYCAQAGFNTTDVPFLEFVVTANSIDLGVLSTSSTATANGTFSVRAWQSGGYSVTTTTDPPKNNNYTLNALATPTASAAGSEQFGINLAANTVPTTFGAVPAQVPDSTFSFGQAVAGYNTANLYKYVKNDIIAQSLSSTSITNYTVSYIFNIKPSTAGGTYTFNHILVATATY